MPEDFIVIDRLFSLQSEVEGYYKQLAGKEKARRLAPQEDKTRIQQQIDEIQADIDGVLQKYWLCWKTEASDLTIPEAEAESMVGKLLPEVDSLSVNTTVQANAELIKLLQEIKAELTKTETLWSGKLKAAIPLLPGFLSYELDLDAEGVSRRLFPLFRNLVEKLKK